jgi:hypothetical protein
MYYFERTTLVWKELKKKNRREKRRSGEEY